MTDAVDVDARLRALRERNQQREDAFAAKLEEVRKQLDLMSQDTQALAKDEEQLAKQFGEEERSNPAGDAPKSTHFVFIEKVSAGVVESAEDRNA